MTKRFLQTILLVCFLSVPLVQAQVDDEDDELHAVGEIVVTGARVTAGGSQDIAFARSEILSGRIPHPDTFTDEGLLSQHDLHLPNAAECDQLFCVIAEAMPSDLVSKPNDQYFVGLGFASNLDANRWQRDAQNVVAVVDKSGSMSGEPLDLVRRSLLALTDELTEDDQLSIVLYGDRSHVYLQPTKLSKDNRQTVREQIQAIASAGSTNMEEGLQVGYQVARQSRSTFDGSTRLILFTDERPNVGATHANSFIGMAREASEVGIGLTTIGVGVQFDSSLAIKISSTRGGNLFFLPDEDAADALFGEEFEYMVSELAHDLNFVVRPHNDLAITGVYGLPGDLLSWTEDRAVSFTVPTVFLSSRGGGIFVSLGPNQDNIDLPAPVIRADDNLLAAAITYVPAKSAGGPESDVANVSLTDDKASHPMRLASLLVDEYLGLREATTEHYVHNNQEGAYQALSRLDGRFESIENRKLEKALVEEAEMVDTLLDKFAFLSGRGAEVSDSRQSRLWGIWQVTETNDTSDYDAFEQGTYLMFSPDNRVFHIEEDELDDIDWDDSQPYVIADSKIVFLWSESAFKYRLKREELTLRYRDRRDDVDLKVVMQFAGAFPMDEFQPGDPDDFDDYY